MHKHNIYREGVNPVSQDCFSLQNRHGHPTLAIIGSVQDSIL